MKTPENLSAIDHQHLIDLQGKLNDIYKLNAQGAFVRSRRRWLEEGAQNSAHFFRLEKFQVKNCTIQKSNINGQIRTPAK